MIATSARTEQVWSSLVEDGLTVGWTVTRQEAFAVREDSVDLVCYRNLMTAGPLKVVLDIVTYHEHGVSALSPAEVTLEILSPCCGAPMERWGLHYGEDEVDFSCEACDRSLGFLPIETLQLAGTDARRWIGLREDLEAWFAWASEGQAEPLSTVLRASSTVDFIARSARSVALLRPEDC